MLTFIILIYCPFWYQNICMKLFTNCNYCSYTVLNYHTDLKLSNGIFSWKFWKVSRCKRTNVLSNLEIKFDNWLNWMRLQLASSSPILVVMEIFKSFTVHHLGCTHITVNYMYLAHETFKVLNSLLIWTPTNSELIWPICKISK